VILKRPLDEALLFVLAEAKTILTFYGIFM